MFLSKVVKLKADPGARDFIQPEFSDFLPKSFLLWPNGLINISPLGMSNSSVFQTRVLYVDLEYLKF